MRGVDVYRESAGHHSALRRGGPQKRINWIDYSAEGAPSTVRPAPAKAPELRLFGMERIAAHVTYKFYREEGRRGNRSRLFSAGQSRGKINLQPD